MTIPETPDVNDNDFRRMALGLAGAVEREHMGHPDFRAPGPSGRIFATIHHDRRTGGLKLTPEEQQRFLAAAPDAFEPAAGAWGRAGATSVRFSVVDEETLGEAVTLAWQNVVRRPPARAKTKPAREKRRSARAE